ncbi:MAG: (2Fe-2S)-binding protein [Candidatus Tectomicrobia bacterium]|nr:(2Fe-2S)-binding protein [Candidatus Tectomicrobia bacterium]
MSMHSISLTINGKKFEGQAEARKLLSDFIREDIGLTGTHVGCEHGMCGACTVFIDGVGVRSCLTFAVQADGTSIETVESLAKDGKLSPLQEAFWENHGLQCGFCTPGMLICAEELLRENKNPTEQEVRLAISGNLCRCTGYHHIVLSILAAAKKLQGAAQAA